MTTPTFPNYAIEDSEERYLAHAISLKKELISTLHLVAEAKKARNDEEQLLGVTESISYEELVLAGYQRALDNRRRQLKLARGRK